MFAFELSELWTNNLEMFAVLTGVLCVGLITVEDKNRALAWFNWPIGAASSAAFAYIFWDYQLYFNSILQVFYVVAAIYGGWSWKYGGEGRTELPIRRFNPPLLCGVIAGVIAGAALLAASYDVLGVEASAPYWDALVVLFSLAAQFIMTRKFYEHWILWILVDIVGVVLFWTQGLELTSVLYVVYGSLCVRGLFTWKTAFNNEQSGIVQLVRGKDPDAAAVS
jgi:nicotinamide mononucleotide transporter PnuC